MVFDKEIIVVPENVVMYANRQMITNELALFLKYKRVFKSGHFHSKSAPEELNICRSTFHNHVKSFIELGWAEKLDHGFRLISIYKIAKDISGIHRKYKFKRLHHFKNGKKADIVSELRQIIFRRKHIHIDFRESAKKQDIFYSPNLRLNKQAKRIIEHGLSNIAAIGIKSIGNLWGMSSATGHRQKMRWQSEGSISVTHQPPLLYQANISQAVYQEFKKSSDYNSTYYHWHNNIYQSQPDQIYRYV